MASPRSADTSVDLDDCATTPPRHRIWIAEELIRHAHALGDAWFATHAEITAWARDYAV